MSMSDKVVVLAFMELNQTFEWIRFVDLQDIEIEKLLVKSRLFHLDREKIFDYHQIKFRVFVVILNRRTIIAKIYTEFLKKMARKWEYSQLLELPFLTKENGWVDPRTHDNLPWLQEDHTKDPFIVTIILSSKHLGFKTFSLTEILQNEELAPLLLPNFQQFSCSNGTFIWRRIDTSDNPEQALSISCFLNYSQRPNQGQKIQGKITLTPCDEEDDFSSDEEVEDSKESLNDKVKIDESFVMTFEENTLSDSKLWRHFQCDLCQTKTKFSTSKGLRSHLATEHFRDIILSNIKMELRQIPVCPKCLAGHFDTFDALLVHCEEKHGGYVESLTKSLGLESTLKPLPKAISILPNFV